jgi:ABC-type antimicrobial peptide transport system permease subunit
MKWQYILELSWRNLMNRKVRSILTISGVVIGIAAITFLISLGYGFENMTTSQISSKNTLAVFDVSLDNSDLASITEKGATSIKELDNVEQFEPALTLAGKLSDGKVNSNITVNGYNNQYLDLNDTKLLRGARYKDTDKDSIIVTTGVLEAFGVSIDNFGSKKYSAELVDNHDLSPSLQNGETKKIENMKIVGVIDDDQSTYIVMPYELIKSEIQAVNFNIAKVKVKDQTKLSDTKSKIENMGYGTNYIGDTIKQIASFFLVFRYIVGGFGFIAMLVAILGMFNTLTVSLLERTREVGVLKSNGAVRKDIWRIFLSEALVISATGGVLGIIFGISIGEAVNLIFNRLAQSNGSEPVDFFYTPVYFVIGTLIATLVVGFVTGYYPSKRATKINALDALKYE